MLIYEQGLTDLVKRVIWKSTFFTTDVKAECGLCVFFPIGAPIDEDGSADFQYVLQVAQTIAVNMDDFKVIVNKSTVLVWHCR